MNMDRQGVPVQNRIFRYLLCALMLLVCVGSRAGHGAEKLPFILGEPFLSVQPMPLEAAERQWLDQRQVLRVGIPIDDYEPVDITSDGNRYQGISADYLSLIAAKLGVSMHVTGFAKRDQAVEALKTGKVDLLTSASGFERGMSDLAVTRNYLTDRAVVVGRRGDFTLSTALSGKRIIALDCYADPDQLQRLYPDSDIVLAPTLFSAVEALTQGDADAFVGNEIVVNAFKSLRPYLGLQTRFESLLPLAGFGFATRAEDTTLLALLNRSLNDLDEAVDRNIQSRWILDEDVEVAPGRRIRLTAAERQWVRKHSQVRIGSTQHAPYVFKDADGHWVGLNIDILDRISRMTGLNFVHHEMPNLHAVLEALSSGAVDMNTTVAETAERRATLSFSYAYGGNSWVYVTQKDNEGLVSLANMSGKVLAMPARHALLEFIRVRYPDVQLVIVPSYVEARRLVESGGATATIQNEAAAWTSSMRGLKVAGSVEDIWSPDRFAVINSEPELLSILNKALDEFPVAEMRAIRAKWLGGIMGQSTLWERIPHWVFWLLAVVLSGVLVSLYWKIRLTDQIRQRLIAEVQLNDQLAFKRALMDGIPEPMYVRDLQGRLVFCNRSYEDSFGISYEQMNGRRLIDVDLIPRDAAEAMHASYMNLFTTHQPLLTERSFTLSGRAIKASQWAVPFYDAGGQLQGLLGGWLDLSEAKGLTPSATRSSKD
ncbi:transporter substrate-binding domain-containing protein [Pseudomonas sp. SLFW]|uniref:transporter substrate-binding domain-containing protein n=1 Tax=Pseudomonas sp. SLFW TaxID=2683259 RepID=UPI0014126501|nr:transporter substrate-binding domain-containing protein [Pseudomonas sp. SLFW]NBB08403.1 transporter substrate-binding domain-containing protein [Pseudomonas sp. SLFW]